MRADPTAPAATIQPDHEGGRRTLADLPAPDEMTARRLLALLAPVGGERLAS